MSQAPPPLPVGDDRDFDAAADLDAAVRDDLRLIASRQRMIILCIVVYLGSVIGQFMVPPDLRPMLALTVLGVGVLATVCVFTLAIKLYGVALGILMGLLTLVPLVGLLILLLVNQRATRMLNDHGIDVGLFGARGTV